MSTNGVLSIVHRGRVKIKLVCGCNGQELENLAEYFQQFTAGQLDIADVFLAAQEYEVGCPDCLVVMDDNLDFEIDDAADPEIGQLYFEKFEDPEFNPRHHEGTAGVVKVLDL